MPEIRVGAKSVGTIDSETGAPYSCASVGTDQTSADGSAEVKLWGEPGDVPVPKDYDRDGIEDLAIWRPRDGTWWVLNSGFPGGHTAEYFNSAQWGLPGAVGLYQAKPPSYLDVPSVMGWAATDIADPQNPVGAKGVGEPLMGCATAALLCAISDALGGHYFNRTPVVRDMIVNAAAGRSQSYRPLAANSQ